MTSIATSVATSVAGHVATLIVDPARRGLTAAMLDAARAALPHARVPVWLDEGVAADIPCAGDGPASALAARLRERLDAPVDVVVQPLADRRKTLFVADMDSTIIGQECIDELADKVGLKSQVAAITERAMRGELVFEPALRQRVALLKGLPASVIDEVIAERIRLNPGARTLLSTLRAHGAHTALVSGGFTLFTEAVARMAGFHETRANRLVIDDGVLAGRVEEPILGADAKLRTLSDLSRIYAARPALTLAAGDGANDLPMLQAAGLGVAFRAKPKVAAAAAARIDHGDLTALLYLQGYRRAEFAPA